MAFIRAFISRTASSMPVKRARLRMLWPMFSSCRCGQGADLGDVDVVDAVPGVHHEAQLVGQRGPAAQALELRLPPRRA